MSRIHVQYGGAETFWDASFSPQQCSALDVDYEELSSISVCVDASGEVSLNRGYEEGSRQGKAEAALWAEYSDEIQRELFSFLSGRDWPEYAAFVTRMAADVPKL